MAESPQEASVDMTRDDAIKKVVKCLDLFHSTTFPNEKETAQRQAKKLSAKYNITGSEVRAARGNAAKPKVSGGNSNWTDAELRAMLAEMQRRREQRQREMEEQLRRINEEFDQRMADIKRQREIAEMILTGIVFAVGLPLIVALMVAL